MANVRLHFVLGFIAGKCSVGLDVHTYQTSQQVKAMVVNTTQFGLDTRVKINNMNT